MPIARAYTADPMAHIDPIGSARTVHGTRIDRENHAASLSKRNDFGARLHPGPLFGEDEFSPSEIAFRFGQQKGRLQRKYVLAIQVLVQAIVVTLRVLQKQGRWLGLAGRMTTREEFGVIAVVARP